MRLPPPLPAPHPPPALLPPPPSRHPAHHPHAQLIIRTPSGRLQIITNLLGPHNADNVLAAVATGVALKAPLPSIVAGVEAVEIPGR